MAQGHMDQECQNKNSTKQQAPLPAAPSPDDNTFPLAPNDGTCSHYCFVAMLKPMGQIYTDQTGKFVTPSSTGNNYILILYDYDSNAILAVPFKNHKSKSILQAYKMGHAQLCAASLHLKLQHLDNEASHALQNHLTAKGVDFQLVLPNLHHSNAAEHAIHTFKNHF